MKKGFLIIVIAGYIISCTGSRQKLQIVSDEKSHSKSICITNPFVYLQVLDSKASYFDAENQKKMVDYLITEAEYSLETQFEVQKTRYPLDSLYFKFGNQLYEFMMKIDQENDWSKIALPDILNDEVNKSDCDLHLFIFNSAFYRTKASMARGIAGSIAMGIMTLGNATIIPSKSISKMYVAIYSKSRKSVIYFDNEEDTDMPIEEENVMTQIRTLLEDFLEVPKSVP
jgi:hypothetical protein